MSVLSDLLAQERQQHEELEALQDKMTVKRVELNHTTLQIEAYLARSGRPLALPYVEHRRIP